jgi:hypothetical protein
MSEKLDRKPIFVSGVRRVTYGLIPASAAFGISAIVFTLLGGEKYYTLGVFVVAFEILFVMIIFRQGSFYWYENEAQKKQFGKIIRTIPYSEIEMWIKTGSRVITQQSTSH